MGQKPKDVQQLHQIAQQLLACECLCLGEEEIVPARRQSFKRSRLEMMQGDAEVHNCRREDLLNDFGEGLDEPCCFCDNCRVNHNQDESIHQNFIKVIFASAKEYSFAKQYWE